VRQHGLAGPGLASDHVQARLEPQLGALDEEQVLYAELQEHARRFTRAVGRRSERAFAPVTAVTV
jgi:hypothetical protein